MRTRSFIVLFWFGLPGLLAIVVAVIDIGLLALALAAVQLLLVRNGLPPADHHLHFNGPAAAVVLVGAAYADFYTHSPDQSAGAGETILAAVIFIMVWSAVDAFLLPRRRIS